MPRRDKTDFVDQYSKLSHGRDLPPCSTQSSRWLDHLEHLVLEFMDRIFHKSAFKASPKPNKFRSGNQNTAQSRAEVDGTLEQVHEVLADLGPEIVAVLQPAQANLIFMNRHNYFMIEEEEALSMIEKFRVYVADPCSADADVSHRITKLVDFVDNVRRLSDFLLQATGYTEIGKSQRVILMELQTKKEPRRVSSSTSKHIRFKE